MYLNNISCWFICKTCRCTLNSISSFVNHKKTEHSKVFQNTECIVFEEFILERNEDTTSQQPSSNTCTVKATKVQSQIPEEPNITNNISMVIKTEGSNDMDPLYTADHIGIGDVPTLCEVSSVDVDVDSTDTESAFDLKFNTISQNNKKVKSTSTILPSIYPAEARVTLLKNPSSSSKINSGNQQNIEYTNEIDAHLNPALRPKTEIIFNTIEPEPGLHLHCVPKLEVLPEIRIIRMKSSTSKGSINKVESTTDHQNPFVRLERLTLEEIQAAISRSSTKYKALLVNSAAVELSTTQHTEKSENKDHDCSCSKAYKYRSDLLRHIRHAKSGKIHGEQYKLKSTNTSNALKRGKQNHRSMSCRSRIETKLEDPTLKMGGVGFLEDDKASSLNQNQSSSSQPKERGENSQRTRLEELLYPVVRPTCHLCQKSFMNKYVRDAHVIVTHSAVKKFQCNCGLKYKNRSDLRRHQKHQRLKKINDSGYNSDCWKPSNAPQSSHRLLQTINSTIRNEQKRKATFVEPVECAVYDSVPNSVDHQPTPNSNLNTISNHINETQTQAKRTAPRCKTKKTGNTGRTSAQKCSAPFPHRMCHLCEKSFKDKHRLDYHVKFTHSSVKRYKCECGKAYKHSSDFKRHQTERELYPCNSNSDDQQPTSPTPNLNTTLNIAIETQTQDTPLTATCSKTKKSLEESVSPLARPTCHLCGKSFKNKIVLRSHLKFTHSKIRQFQCHCGKTYKSPSDLARHRKKQRSKNVNDAGYNSDCLKFSIVPSSRHRLRTLQTLSSTLEEPKRETSNGDLVEDTVCYSAPVPPSSSSHVNGTHSQVKFQCNCGKIYKSRSGLQRHRKKQRSKTVSDKGYNLDCMKSRNVPRNGHPSSQTLNSTIREEPKSETGNGDLIETNAVYDSVPNSDECKPTPNSNLNDIASNATKPQAQAIHPAPSPSHSAETKHGNTQRTNLYLQELSYPLTQLTCHLCEKSFRNKYALHCHTTFTHSSVKRVNCECGCGKAYKNRSNLMRHHKETKLCS